MQLSDIRSMHATVLGGRRGAGARRCGRGRLPRTRPPYRLCQHDQDVRQQQARRQRPGVADGNLAVQRMGSYVPLVGSTELAQRIIDQLQLRDTPLKVARSLSATVDKDTVLMTVSAKASSPGESEAIVGAMPVTSPTWSSTPHRDRTRRKTSRPRLFTTFDGPSTQRTRSHAQDLAVHWPSEPRRRNLHRRGGRVTAGQTAAGSDGLRSSSVTSPRPLVVGIIPKDGTFDPISVPAGSRRHRWDAYRRFAYNLQCACSRSLARMSWSSLGQGRVLEQAIRRLGSPQPLLGRARTSFMSTPTGRNRRARRPPTARGVSPTLPTARTPLRLCRG